MPKIEIVDSGVVYINPDPGYRYDFACHSHVAQISERELLCTFQRGQALYSVDSLAVVTRSTDGGKTWVQQGLLHDPEGDDRPYSYHGPFVTRLADGTLVVNAIRWDRSDPAKPLFNEKTGGILPAETILLRSTDGAATWSGPQVVALPDGMVITPSCPIVVLADGRWLHAFDEWHSFDAPGPYKPRTVGLFSSDAGLTWGDPVAFADGAPSGKGHWHGKIIRLRDDRLFTLFWSAETGPQAALPLYYCLGTADGREWTTPAPTNIPGQTNWPVELADGRMVVLYTVRDTEPPGFFAAYSEDGGKTWDLDGQVMVWDATGRDKIGVSAPDDYPRSHDTIAYGAPTATVLDNGDVFCSFWCTELSTTHIRCARLRVV